jgi:hypothetical protein
MILDLERDEFADDEMRLGTLLPTQKCIGYVRIDNTCHTWCKRDLGLGDDAN